MATTDKRPGERMQAAVLAVLKRHGEPLSAYDILGALREDHPKIAPPTIYRALGALTAQGSVHRLESLNAYVACSCERHEQAAILSICNTCGTVEESVAPDVMAALGGVVHKTGFAAMRHVIEVHGVCASCSPGRSPA